MMSKFSEWMELAGSQLLVMAGLGLVFNAASVAVHLWVPESGVLQGQLQGVAAGCYGSMLTLLRVK